MEQESIISPVITIKKIATPQKIIIPPKNPIIRKPVENNNSESNLKSLIEEKNPNPKNPIDDKFDRTLKSLIEDKNEKNIKNSLDEKNEKSLKSLTDNIIDKTLICEENLAKEPKISLKEEKMEEEKPINFLESKTYNPNFLIEQLKDTAIDSNKPLIEQASIFMSNDYNTGLTENKNEKGGDEMEISKENANFEEKMYDIEGPLYNIENEVIDSLHDLEVKSDDLKENEVYLEELQKTHSFNIENDFRNRFENQLDKVMKKPDLKNLDKLLEVHKTKRKKITLEFMLKK